MERTITITEKQFKEICAEACAEIIMDFTKDKDDKGTLLLMIGLTATAVSGKIGDKLFPKEPDALGEFMSAMNKVKGEMENDF